MILRSGKETMAGVGFGLYILASCLGFAKAFMQNGSGLADELRLITEIRDKISHSPSSSVYGILVNGELCSFKKSS
jgi:hypothetical protein